MRPAQGRTSTSFKCGSTTAAVSRCPPRVPRAKTNITRRALSDFDPYSPPFVEDPYATYRVLRERPTATWSESDQGWLITRYDDVAALLRDHETFSSDDRRALRPRDRSRSRQRRSMVGSDPPDHSRLRKVIAKRFKAPAVPTRPKIEQIVDELFDHGLRGGQIELMDQLAVPLPLLLTADMLGIDRASVQRLRAWSDAESLEIHERMPLEETARLEETSLEMHAYFRAAIDDARARGKKGATLFDELLSAADDDAQLVGDELLTFLVLLARAGTHTVTHLIGNAALVLVKHRPELETLRVQPELWPKAMDELLRFAGPVHAVARIATREVVVHGVTVQPGERVLAVPASANRDESRFPRPDELRFDRNHGDHVALGVGVHFCLGAQLGSLEAQVALERLVDRMPLLARVELLREPDWGWTWAVRGLRRLLLRGGP